MDDLKLFAKSKNQIHSLVETVHKFSEDIGIQMVIKKWITYHGERKSYYRKFF